MLQLVRDLENKLKLSQCQVHELSETVSQLRKDQDDLLILMSDQETKIETYKSKLKLLGHPVSIPVILSTLFVLESKCNPSQVDDDDVNAPTESAVTINGFPDV